VTRELLDARRLGARQLDVHVGDVLVPCSTACRYASLLATAISAAPAGSVAPDG
jgi:hypothetical protein